MPQRKAEKVSWPGHRSEGEPAHQSGELQHLWMEFDANQLIKHEEHETWTESSHASRKLPS